MCMLGKFCFAAGKVLVAMSKFSSAVKIDLEKFDGIINFDLWRIQVKDVLIQLGLCKNNIWFYI